jgi:hypothetical protein
VGGSNTDSSGVAVFNVANPSDTTIRYAIQVNPSWTETNYAAQIFTNNGQGYTYAQINNQSFTLGSPNLTVTSKSKTGSSVNLGGWVCAEYFNNTNGYSTQWISCQGLNQLGTAKMLLPNTDAANVDQKYIRLTFNSGDSSYGATISCTVTVTAGVVAGSGLASGCSISGGSITQNLSAGNVQGVVKRASDNTGVAGAIIKATIHGESGSDLERDAIMTTSGSDGSFGLQLDSSKLWDIKIIPVHVDGLADLDLKTVQDNSGASTGNGVQPPSGAPALTLINLSLVTKP